jgi:hypothetical protein
MDVPAPHHFAGIDWASDKHDACVLDPAGKVCLHLCIRHTAEGLAELIRDHPHTIRILARAWTRALWRCCHEPMLYDPRSHGRALPFLAPETLPIAA